MAKQTILLGELVKSAWQKVNENFTELYNLMTNKVDKEAGKGLSTNDYTTDEKTKLSGIAEGAQVNVLEAVKVDGVTQTITDKAVNIDLSAFAKKADIASAYNYKGSKATYAELPTTGNTVGDVWNVEADGMNYAWTGTEWDALGGSIDLSGYMTTEQVNAALANKVDKVDGKGLSTNDFTTEEKTKLAGLSAPTKHEFIAGGWGTVDSDGYYNMTITASGKYPVKVMRNISGVYTEALVQTAVSGANVILTSEEAFEGYVILI